MKKRINLFILYLCSWYLLFVLARIVFLVAYGEKTMHLNFSEIANTFIYGLKLDFAIAGYISILPSLVLTITSFTKNIFTRYFYNIYTLLSLFFVISVLTGDLVMYKFWGFRIDATPLYYMTNFKAVTASVSELAVAGTVLSILLITCLLFYGYYSFFNKRLRILEQNPKSFIVLLLFTMMLAVVMRGGIGLSGQTTSSAYFSKKQFANHAAINPIWNFGYSITESKDLHKKYNFYSEKEVQKILAPLRSPNLKSVNLLRNNRPNIILIITESLTAKALEATGGKPEIMPQLNQLISEGVLFNQVYAVSDRTDKGLAAVIAGYPSLPGSSPLKYQKLTQKLAFLPQKLNAEGYRSGFYYGGTLIFANYQAFLVQAGYDKMISDKDFPAKDLQSKWGAYDGVLLERCLADTPDTDTKFFKTILTLTSHEPFETPVPTVFKGDDDDTRFLNSLHYTDASIGSFIKKAKTRSWWSNTLVIIIADHGSMRPGNSEMWQKSKYHIPMLWLGGALNVRDTVISNLASQSDLAATLLTQLDMNADDFIFSKNILNKAYIPYSYFAYSGGFGFQKPDDLVIFNTVTSTYPESTGKSESTIQKQGKAFLQSMFMDFYNKNR